jgi:hypothetical protein
MFTNQVREDASLAPDRSAIEAALTRAGLSQVFAFCPINDQVPPAHRV